MNDDRIVRLPEVCEITGLKKTWVYELERQGRFPRRRKLSTRASGWLHSELVEWVRARPVADPRERAA